MDEYLSDLHEILQVYRIQRDLIIDDILHPLLPEVNRQITRLKARGKRVHGRVWVQELRVRLRQL